MRKHIISFTLVLCCLLLPVSSSDAQILEIIKAAVVKVIKAIDLQIQRQQNKVIWLQNAQKELENTMAKTKLDEITGWVNKQKELYQQYYDELKKVKAVLAYYQRIKDIMNRQVQLVQEYRRAWNLFRQDERFTPDELDYMAKVYTGIMDETVQNIEQMKMVINSFRTQMSDAKRLELIDQVDERVQTNFDDLKLFNRQNALLSLQRAKSKQELEAVKKWYGIQ